MVKRNREGDAITLLAWADLSADEQYRLIANETVGHITVRTVWEGIDEYPGAMFATGVAPDGVNYLTVTENATTEAEAIAAHRAVVDHVRAHTEGDLMAAIRERLRATP